MLWQVLERGCRVWLSPPPFDHTKLMLVDRAWTLFGSGNWDPRSLRLNFEFDVECYDCALAEQLYHWMDRKAQDRPARHPGRRRRPQHSGAAARRRGAAADAVSLSGGGR